MTSHETNNKTAAAFSLAKNNGFSTMHGRLHLDLKNYYITKVEINDEKYLYAESS